MTGPENATGAGNEPAAAPGGAAGTQPPAPGNPSAPVVLTSKERRAVREEARREFKAAELARMQGKAGPSKAAPPSKAKPAEAEAGPDTRTDETRATDAGAFLSGVVFPLVGLFLSLFGYQLQPLTTAEAREDGAAWVPLARRYRWLDSLFTWGAAPARLIARVKVKATRKPATSSPPADPPAELSRIPRKAP